MKKIKLKSGLWINLLIAAAAVCAMVFLANSYMRGVERTVQADTSQTLREVSQQSARLIRERLENDLILLDNMALSIGIYGGAIDSSRMSELLGNYANGTHFEQVAISDPIGNIYLTDGAGGGNISEKDYFRRALLGESAIAGGIETAEDGMKYIAFTAPIYRRGVVVGVLEGRHSVDQMQDLLSVDTFHGEGVRYIAQSTGAVFARSNSPNGGRRFQNVATDFAETSMEDQNDLPAMLKDMQSGKNGEVFYIWEGAARIMNYTPVGVNGWYLLSAVPRGVVTAKSTNLIRQAIYLVSTIVTVFLLVMLYVYNLQRRSRLRLQDAHREVTTMYNTMPGGVFRCKYDGVWTVQSANDGFYRFLGYSRAEFERRFLSQLDSVIYPDDRGELKKSVRTQMKAGSSFIHENRVVCADGSVKWIWMNGELTEDEALDPCFYCAFMDVTDLRETQEALRLSQQRYEMVLDQTQETIFEWNLRDRTIYLSKNFTKKFGWEPSGERFPDSFAEAGIVPDADRDAFFAIFRGLEEGAPCARGEFRICKIGGGAIWCRTLVSAITGKDGKPLRAVGLFSDIEDERQKLAQAEESAQRDSLTKLYNKGTTRMLIENYLKGGSAPAALLAIDIDDFKGVNDTLGHLYGDAVLSGLAGAMRAAFREPDIVGRIGGDEFVVFLKNVYDPSGLHRRAQEVINAFNHSFAEDYADYKISGSVGIALYPKDANAFDPLFEKADVALYYAKRHGKNQYAFYNAEMEQENRTAPVRKNRAGEEGDDK